MHFQQIPNSMRGGGLDRQKKKKIPNLQLFPNLEGGVSGEVGMVSHFFTGFSYESFHYLAS